MLAVLPSTSTGDSYFQGGNVGIGTSSPSRKLHVYSGASGQGTPNADANLVIEDSGGNTLNMLSPNANYNALYFGDVTSAI